MTGARPLRARPIRTLRIRALRIRALRIRAMPLAAGLALALAACPGTASGPGGSPAPATAALRAGPRGAAPTSTPPPLQAAPTPVPARGPPGAVWVTTLAGGGVPGLADGSGVQARFDWPTAVLPGPDGTLYVLDQTYRRIRRIGRDGQVATVRARAAAGAEPSAEFVAVALALDASGSLVFLDFHLPVRVRRIDPDGTLATVAEIPADFQFETAPITGGAGIALDATGNVFVAGLSQILRAPPGGSASVLAGNKNLGFRDGDGTAAEFDHPTGMVADRAGNLFVADTFNHRIRKITPDGRVTRVTGSFGGHWDGPAAGARLDRPMGLALAPDGGLVWVDSGSELVRRLDAAGNVSTIAGGASRKGLVDGAGADARFRFPTGIAVDPAGRVFVADAANSAIRAIDVPW